MIMNFDLVIVVVCQIFGKGGYHCIILIGTNFFAVSSFFVHVFGC